MNRLYLMTTIIDRNQTRCFLSFYQEYGAEVVWISLGHGTASSEVLGCLGLEATAKAVLFSVVTDSVWQRIRSGLEERLGIGIPGTGIAFTVPLSSIAGKRQLAFLTGAQAFEKGEESELKGTAYELLIAVANQGYAERVMVAARSAKAGGGTVIHAKGTGQEGAEQFLGVKLAAEKELVLLVVRTEQKNTVMRAILEQAGLGTKAKAIVFSLPVTEAAGLRLGGGEQRA